MTVVYILFGLEVLLILILTIIFMRKILKTIRNKKR